MTDPLINKKISIVLKNDINITNDNLNKCIICNNKITNCRKFQMKQNNKYYCSIICLMYDLIEKKD